MSTEVHKKFEFGTVFGDDGAIVSRPAPREKRFFLPEEVEEIRRAALKEGEASVTARAELARAEALRDLAAATEEGLGLLQELTQMHKEGCVALALICAQKIAAESLSHFPEAPLKAALSALEAEIDTAARLIITLPQPDEALEAAAREAAELSGFAGNLVFRAGPGKPTGAFEIQWADGRAEFDPERVGEQLMSVLKETLAAEAHQLGQVPQNKES
jgi:flagellar assembly protein FliH